MNRQAANRFYASPRWRTLRARMLAEADYRCSQCERLDGIGGYWGRLELHHKTPLLKAPKKGLERDNLIVLCRQCHFDLHAKDRETDPARKAWVNHLSILKQEISNGHSNRTSPRTRGGKTGGNRSGSRRAGSRDRGQAVA